MWTYQQQTGKLFAEGGIEVGEGYSGTGIGRNAPDMESVPFVGPCPKGGFLISPAYDHPKLGPLTMDLVPDPENEMYGRDEFRIHGDSADHDASEGCNVQDHAVRLRVSQSLDRRLQVV